MSKVTSKLQVTIPKSIADRYAIEPGDDIEFVPAGERIYVKVPLSGSAGPRSVEERLRLFDEATKRQRKRNRQWTGGTSQTGRGWTREDLYEDRGSPR